MIGPSGWRSRRRPCPEACEGLLAKSAHQRSTRGDFLTEQLVIWSALAAVLPCFRSALPVAVKIFVCHQAGAPVATLSLLLLGIAEVFVVPPGSFAMLLVSSIAVGHNRCPFKDRRVDHVSSLTNVSHGCTAGHNMGGPYRLRVRMTPTLQRESNHPSLVNRPRGIPGDFPSMLVRV